ncbi:hypothetical protein [Leucobacter ruminantium]|uniref:Uncharacterized protein n=1 Tax=Leucobacter ruminantium TaxID=1289170 RepID=A0A939LWA4_9MICO|nr:hypothetical protein [Leucobacter ruminantium]MBO1805900.1 hypothetical protein [Leucobacter ruminantium]
MAVNVIEIGPGTLTIGAPSALTDFSDQCVSAELIPSVDKEKPRRVLSGKNVPGARTESVKLQCEFLNDFGAQDSRSEWLWEHRGQEVPFNYVPNSSAGKAITGTLVVEPIAIGGKAGEKPEKQVEFDLVDPPVFEAV